METALRKLVGCVMVTGCTPIRPVAPLSPSGLPPVFRSPVSQNDSRAGQFDNTDILISRQLCWDTTEQSV